MNLTEFEAYLEARIPSALRCHWDNDGRMLLPEPNRQIKRVIVALDATQAVIDRAVEAGADLILTHHPYIFRPLRSIDQASQIALIRAGVAVYSFHTRLDAMEGGVNDRLAQVLGIRDCVPFGEDNMGRVGYLDDALTADAFARMLKDRLGSQSVTVYDAKRPIRRVALLGGAGKDLIADAIKVGADAFVTGEAGYNALLDAEGSGMSIFCAGHYETEFPICDTLARFAREANPNAEVEIMDVRVLKEL